MGESFQINGTESGRGPTPDRVLLERVALGDERAFGELYDRHRLSLYALAYGIVMDAADADAVVSEVFDHVWLKTPQLDSIQGSAHAWLADVARAIHKYATAAAKGHAESAIPDDYFTFLILRIEDQGNRWVQLGKITEADRRLVIDELLGALRNIPRAERIQSRLMGLLNSVTSNSPSADLGNPQEDAQ
jgi:DNA-directed RNA polymerase specialized sigma24 family protein